MKATIAEINQDVEVDCKGFEDISNNDDFDCVINSTTVGMSPNIDSSPVPDGFFSSNALAFDLVYNPQKTRFLSQAEKAGCKTANGMQMLVAQAVYSVEIWMGGNIVAHVDMNALVRDLEKLIK